MIERKPLEIIAGQPASDGAGVKLLRVFGGVRPERFDPFLMLDEFGSEEASDYIAGFPPHPHRGFETITYMLCGKMEHKDHMNNVGLLNDGDVQWMTAGRGVVHSEMPKQTEGRMRGFQLWLNLPAKEKMDPARYTDLGSENIPVFDFSSATVKAIAGEVELDGEHVKGYFQREATQPVVMDIKLKPNAEVTLSLDSNLNVMLYAFDGHVRVAGTELKAQQLMRLGDGDVVKLSNTSDQPASLLLVAGKPIKEPIVQYGPFVMNSAEEIEQALRDYREGRLTA